jgi:Zn-dependent protease
MSGQDPWNWQVKASYPNYYRTYGQKHRGLLSPEEKRNLAIAMGALTLCLGMAMLGGLAGTVDALQNHQFNAIFIFAIAAVTTTTGFALHELSHKFTAQRYGCWAEFRYSIQGLGLALVTAAIGFLFASPGAVYIAGAVDKRQNGIISLAGPMANVAVVLAILPIAALGLGGDLISFGLMMVAYFNAFLAVFNMIPVMPLDGAKVLKWNLGIYIVSMALVVVLLVLTWVVKAKLTGYY